MLLCKPYIASDPWTSKGPWGLNPLSDPIYVGEYWGDFRFHGIERPYGDIQHKFSFNPTLDMMCQ